MATFVHSPGQGSLLTNHDKANDKAPDLAGVLVLSKDYAAGDTVRIGAWTKNTPKGVIISMRENNWKPDNTTQYPKETNRRDDEVPF